MHRILWLDADARLKGPLEFAVEPEQEAVAGVWWTNSKDEFPELGNFETITGGLLFFQGRRGGSTERLLQSWKEASLAEIRNLRKPTVMWLDADQETLTETICEFKKSDEALQVVKLDAGLYSGDVYHDGTAKAGVLVDQWMMGRKMKRPGTRNRDWPPPEELRG
jgi:hypothetical protein